MASILIVYSTTDGHTRKICDELVQAIEQLGERVTVCEIGDPSLPDPAGFDRIVIGASIRYGKHDRAVYDFIERHQDTLQGRPSAFFSVNLVARKPHKRQPDTNPYVRKFLTQITWRPDRVGVFAGKLNYPIYTPLDRLIIRLIMWMTKGPTDPATVAEFTDWDQVRDFAADVVAL